MTQSTATTTWNIDPKHSSAEFKVKHMMISNVKGKFGGLNGVLHLDGDNVATSDIEASIDVSTINTHDEQRDGHLKSAEFFDVEKYPTMTFKSTEIDATRSGESFNITGDLTIHGVTNPVTFAVDDLSLPAKDPWGNTRIGLSATAKINRKAYGLNWNATLEAGGVLVGDDVAITLDVQFVKQ